MNRWIGLLGVLASAGLAAAATPQPGAVTTAHGRATPTVSVLPGVVRAVGIEDGEVVAATAGGPEVLRTWRHPGRTWADAGTRAGWTPAEAAKGPGCAPDAPGADVPGSAPGWSASLCADGSVVVARQGVPLRVVLSTPTERGAAAGARWLSAAPGTATLVTWSADRGARVATFRDDDVVPVRWERAWMPAGPALDWPTLAQRQEDPTPAVLVDLELPAGVTVVGAAVVGDALTLLGQLDGTVVLLETPWIAPLPRVRPPDDEPTGR